MKFIASIVLTAVLGFASCLYLPWWSIAIIAFAVELVIRQKPGYAFLSGFLAIFLLWTGMASVISVNNDHILANKMALFILGAENPVLLILLSGLLGGVVAGLAALSASLLRLPKAAVRVRDEYID